jgi:hypothetical protein
MMFALNGMLMNTGLAESDSFRYSAVIMSFIYMLGIVALIWAPETKGQPLPED